VQPHVLGADSVHLDGLIAVEAGQVGYERLDNEDAVVGEVCGHVRKAAELLLLRLQAEEGMKTTYTSVYRPSTATSAKSPNVTGMLAPPCFERRRATIPSEASIPRTSMPRSARGSAMRPVPICPG
jgi:hypothetical protein